MIHLNPPRRERKLLALGCAHFLKARRPVLRCAVCGANPKYFDVSKSLEPAARPVTAAQPGLRNGFQLARADANLAVGFEPRQKMPAQRAHQFQIFNRRIPTVETHQLGIKPALIGFEEHFGEMVIFGFAITVFIKHTVIYRHPAHPIRPQQSNQIDALDHRFLLARPVPINQSVAGRVGFLKGRIIKNQKPSMQVNLRLRLCPQHFRVWFKAQQKSGKSVVRRSVSALRLAQRGFGSGNSARRSNNKVNVIFVPDFWRIHTLVLSNNRSTA